MKYLAVPTLALTSLASGAVAPSAPDCAALFEASQRLIPGLRPYVARTYPAGSDFLDVEYPAHNLTEFCRFGANYNTSSISSIQFEIWLPTLKKWNGRFAHVGNGGDAGFIFYGDMGVSLTKYGFAVAGTNTGHNGTSNDGTFAISNPESQLDFGYRAVHLSTIFSKRIVQEYYKKTPLYNYWLGCSSGGKQGMKEIQEFPEDYDGIAITAPGQWWPQLLGYLVHMFNLNNYPTPPAQTIPTWCQRQYHYKFCGSPNPSPFVNASTCITNAQAKTINLIYRNWTSASGELLFPTYLPGSEAGWGIILGETPFQLAPDYFLYQVYNYTSIQPALHVNETELERITKLAEATDPGRINAFNLNLKPFFKRGGKLLGFHGLADPMIPALGSTLYYEKVRAYMNDPHLGNNYRLFLIPGMGHCGGGTGADGFGRPQQAEDYLGGLGQSLVFDRKHDSTLALMEWVEKGKVPNSIIGASYENGNKTQGVAFTRLFCPYPEEAKYASGDVNNATSYRCE